MKKFLLLVMTFVASWGFVAVGANPSAAELQQIAVDFDWDNGNHQNANDGTVWYKVDLSKVASDENLLLYLNNMSATDAQVSVRVALVFGTSVQIQDDATVTRTIEPNRNYAKEIAHNLFGKVSMVYVELTTSQHVLFAAEPVEPGEKDLNCLNAPEFVRQGTTIDAGKAVWYKVDLSDLVQDPSKTIQVRVQNLGNGAATINGGLSMDCPSSGVTEKTVSLGAGEVKTYTARRTYIDLVGDEGMVYVLVETDQPIFVSTEVVDAPQPAVTYDVVNPIDVDLDVLYQLNGGATQWYKMDISKIDVKRQMPEVTLENKSNAKANVEAVLIYANPGDALTGMQATAVRTFSVNSGSALVREVQRNMVEAIADKYQTAYLRVTTDNAIEFIARMKARAAGTQCLKAVNFDWTNGNIQQAATTVWYAVSIAEAKAEQNKQTDIKVKVENLSRTAATLSAQIATSCPCDITQDMTRTVPANDSLIKVLKHSLYSAMSTDTVWVGLTTSQNVHVYAELVPAAKIDTIWACHDSIEFDWDNGHLQTLEAGSTVDTAWYAVPIYKILTEANKNGQVPEITVTNRGNAAATVKAEISFECPVVTEMQSRTIQIAAGDKYVKSPTMDLINSIDSTYEYIYIRVITDQDIAIQAVFKYEEEGKFCSTAEEFNWTLGADYKAAEPYWYSVNIKEARDNEQDIFIRLTNNNSTSVNVKAEATAECPIVNGTTAYTYTIAANSVKEQRLTYATLAGIASDIVYVRVTAEKDVHIDAYTKDDPSTVTNICEGADAVEFIDFDWENGHVQGAETKWYRVALDTLRGDMVPAVVVENLGNGKTTVRGEVAFKCEVKLESMMGKTIELDGKGATKERTADKAMMAIIDSTMTYAYIRVTSSDSIRFNGGLVNPNTGDECYKAIDFDWENGNLHTAGDTLWYKVDITYVTGKQGKAAVLGLKNNDGFNGRVHADFFFTCEDSIPFESHAYNLAGDARKELKLGRELFTSLSVDEVLIRLYADQLDSIYARLYDEEQEDEPVAGCDDAIEAQLNLIIEQKAGVNQWYYVDIANIKAVDQNGETYTKGNALLEIWNSSESNNLTAQLAWECEPQEKMLKKTLSLAGDEEYSHVFQRSLIDNVNKDKAWVYVTTEKDMKFRVTMEDLRGSACLNPIDYDWENGNTHPAGDSLWYKISLDTLNTEFAKDKDLKISVVNLSENEAEATAVVMQGCGVNDTLGTASRILAPNDTLTKEISHVVIDSVLQGEPIYVYLTSTENVYLKAELIGKMDPVVVDTLIVDTVCDGTSYWAYVANGDSVEHVISTDLVQSFPVTWTDTIPFIYDNVYDADSIRRYEIHVITMPTAPKIEDLPITIYAGRAMDFTAVNDTILDYFKKNAADTVATVDSASLTWEYIDMEEVKRKPVTDEKVGFDQKQVMLVYSIVTSCGDTIGSSIYGTAVEVDTTYIHRDTVEQKVCQGEEVTIAGKNYVIAADTAIVDTFLVVDWDATLKQDVDSIKTYQYLVWKQPALLTQFEQEDMPVAQNGKAVDVKNTTVAIKEDIAAQHQSDTMVVATQDSVYWQIKDGAEYKDLTTEHIDSVETVTLRYGVKTEVCDTTYFSEDIVVNVAAKDSFVVTIVDTVCYNDLFMSHDNPQGIAITDSTKWTERFSYAASAEQDVDSVYHYNIYVYLDYTEVQLPSIETQVGKILSTAEIEEELRGLLDAQNNLDGLKATYKDITWAVKTGSYTMGERITSEDPISLEYTVSTNECTASTLTGEVTVNIAPVDSVVAPVVTDTVCANSEFASRLETKTITANAQWTERVALADTTDKAQWKDSVYMYEIYVYETPQAVDLQSQPTASCGKPVDVAEAETELARAYTDNGLQAPVDSIYWEIDLGEGWTPLTEEALSTAVKTFSIRYNIHTVCDEVVTGNTMEITVADDCVEVEENIVDTVCAGTNYATRMMDLTINELTELTQTVMATDAVGNHFDSIYNYTIYVYKEIEIPAQDAVDGLPQAVCGEEIRLEETTEELEALFHEDPLTEPISDFTWEIDLGNGYEPLTDQVIGASISTVSLRYTVVGLCNTKQGEFTVKVEKPNSINNPDKYEEQQAVEKYEGWLLMINYNKLSAKAQELGMTLTENDVVWYKVNGEPDITTMDVTDLADDSVGVGYYYTKQEILPAGDEYYALIKIPVTQEEDCGGSMYTNFITIKKGATPLNLAPNVVKPGDEMYITGLNAEYGYTVSVFDLTGVCVERYDVNGAESYTLKAQPAAGYYMVQVSTDAEEAMQETFKYVVK